MESVNLWDPVRPNIVNCEHSYKSCLVWASFKIVDRSSNSSDRFCDCRLWISGRVTITADGALGISGVLRSL